MTVGSGCSAVVLVESTIFNFAYSIGEERIEGITIDKFACRIAPG